jgi:hypothetical protein
MMNYGMADIIPGEPRPPAGFSRRKGMTEKMLYSGDLFSLQYE